MWLDGGFVPRQVERLRPVEWGFGCECVLCDIDQHGTGTSRGGDVKGLFDGQWNVFCVLYQEAVFRDGHHDSADIGLLESVSADGRGVHLTGDGHEWRGVHVGVTDRSHKIRRPRAGGGEADPNLPARDGVAFSGMPAALFVAHQDVLDLRVEQRVVCGQDRPAGDTEGYLHPDALERLDERLRTRQQLAVCPGHRSPFGCSPELLRSTKNPRCHRAREGTSRQEVETLSDDYELTTDHASKDCGMLDCCQAAMPTRPEC